MNGKELLGREMRVQKATSGGPYPSENGEQGETASGETKNVRARPRAKVYNPLTFFQVVSWCVKSHYRDVLTTAANELNRETPVGLAKPRVKNRRKLGTPLRKKPLNLPRNLAVADSKRRRRMKAFLRKRTPVAMAKGHPEGLLAKDRPRMVPLALRPSTLQTFLLSTRMTRYV